MENKFLIPLNGLAPGKTAFDWSADKEFFSSFGNEEILDADVTVKAVVEKAGAYLGIDVELDGYLVVACDRCLADLEIPISPRVALSVKFHGAENAGADTEGDREVICVPEGNTELDLGQIIYDYACLAMPLQRVHAEGGCDPLVAGRLGEGKEDVNTGEDSPFAALKGLFDN